MSSPSIASVTPTVCAALGVPTPALSTGHVFEKVLRAVKDVCGGRCVQRCLLYAPDAIGTWLLAENRAVVSAVEAHAPIEVAVQSVFPPKTPVCFASMFTGARPVQHGIRTYEKPALACDTLFDALVRAGKRAAIVAVTDSSVDRLFRNRAIDYFSEKYDAEVTERTLALLAEDRHEFIVAYHQEYDDFLHQTEPRSPQCLAALGRHAASFDCLARAARERWSAHDWLLGFCPDHGSHIEGESGKGTHGENIPEDMDVQHFYGAYARRG